MSYDIPMNRVALGAATAIATTLVVVAPAGPGAATHARSCARPPELPKVFAWRVDNQYFPLRPGTTFTYRGREDGKAAKDVVTVTRRAKTILGVRITVVRDRVFVQGKLAEDTLDWYAQDANGNVWYFGEDTKEFEDGRVVTTQGSWQAGRHGARAGIFMPATPKVGRTLKQEDAKNVAEDCSTIADRNAVVRTPFISSRRALETEEFSLLERGVLDHKFYVRGIGLVKEQTVQGGSDVLELVSVKRP
jgi:hypothetical protein